MSLHSKFDDLAHDNKRLSIFCSKLLQRVFNVKYSEDLAFVFAATLATSFWQFDNYMIYGNYIKQAVAIFALLVWVYVSFISGFKRNDSFVFVALGYWILPEITIIVCDSTPLTGYSRILDLVSTISNILVTSPTMILQQTGLSSYTVVIVALIIFELLFAIGFCIRHTMRKSSWYCEFRRHYQ